MKKIIYYIGTDGLLHITCSAVIVLECRRWGLPRWAAGCIALAAGAGKEIYDKVSGKGTPSWKDIVYDLTGILIAMI